ncbi:MAG TPA: GntR family transcriptional regulator [Casimicrobiaceae bacterium]|nr:GntR family transcriptional regulator [Casimicrobiaceae bacterium]
MDDRWDERQPIYRQIKDRVIVMILDGVLPEGESLPSVRTIATELRVNPLTVLKSYQELVDDGLVESRRGRGMFIREGARQRLLVAQRERFLADEWPRIVALIERLGLSLETLASSSVPRKGRNVTRKA